MWMDRHDKANSQFLQFGNVPKNMVTVRLAVMTLSTPRGATLCPTDLGLSTPVT